MVTGCQGAKGGTGPFRPLSMQCEIPWTEYAADRAARRELEANFLHRIPPRKAGPAYGARVLTPEFAMNLHKYLHCKPVAHEVSATPDARRARTARARRTNRKTLYRRSEHRPARDEERLMVALATRLAFEDDPRSLVRPFAPVELETRGRQFPATRCCSRRSTHKIATCTISCPRPGRLPRQLASSSGPRAKHCIPTYRPCPRRRRPRGELVGREMGRSATRNGRLVPWRWSARRCGPRWLMASFQSPRVCCHGPRTGRPRRPRQWWSHHGAPVPGDLWGPCSG